MHQDEGQPTDDHGQPDQRQAEVEGMTVHGVTVY